MFADFDSIAFDVNEYYDQPSVLLEIQYTVFSRLGLIERFHLPEETLRCFLEEVKKKYAPIPFHNFLHATDVTHMLYLLLTKGGVRKHLSDMEVLALVLSAVSHDMGHSGATNAILVTTQSDLIAQFGEESTLEMYSYDTLWHLIEDHDENNLLAHCCERDVYDQLRSLTHDIILATDLKHHFSILEKFTGFINVVDEWQQFPPLQHVLLAQMTIKIADLSNVFRPAKTAKIWARYLMEEFFNQGDLQREYNLPVSPLNDRASASVPEIQVSFYQNIAEPLLHCMTPALESSHTWIETLRDNRTFWEQQI